MIGTSITERRLLPLFLRKFLQVKGVCLGECIDGERIDDHTVAHAHAALTDKYRGWICCASAFTLFDERTMLHEVAHILSPSSNPTRCHDKYWRATVKRIGGTYKTYPQLCFSIPIRDYTHADPIRKRR